jgi:hypothetical protein
MWTGLAVAMLASLALQAVLVAAIAAWRPAGNIYVTIVLVSLVTAPLAFMADRMLLGPWTALGAGQALDWDGKVFLVLIHLALGGFFFHFMTLPDRSVTLRILVELLVAPGQALTKDDLGRRYSVRTMITSRLDQLSAGEFVAIDADRRIVLGRKGVWFGRFVTAGRKLFRIASAN